MMKNLALLLALCISLALCSVMVASAGNSFYDKVDINWGNGRAQILENGNLLTLILDKTSGSGFQSKSQYLYAKLDMKIKLVPKNSAGTVTAFFLSSKGDYHDEIDFEFLGNLSGDPYTLHTNIFCQGVGNREMQFKLWFDPTLDFHTYTILWNYVNIIFYVDGIPIRQFKNNEDSGVPYPKYQAMILYSSLWEADEWATRGGLVKIDWTNSPFTASYRNFNEDACYWSNGNSYCSPDSNSWLWATLDYSGLGQMNWAQQNYMIYDYCKDTARFPQGLPLECYLGNSS